MNKKNIVCIAVVIVVGVASFYGGMTYAKSKTLMRGQGGTFSQNGGFAGRGGRNMGTMGGFTTGEIISKDDKSITVKLMNGGSKIIFLSDTTKISKSVDGTSSDLSTGTTVSVVGTTNPDGSVSATSVQIRPAMPATNN